jgi:hypothetical protein
VLAGAEVVVDVANSPSFEDQAAMEFFQTAGRNLTAAEVAAGVRHHVALSVVGTERLQASGYFRAKPTQENYMLADPYTLVRATQFFEFIRGIAQSATAGDTVRLSHSLPADGSRGCRDGCRPGGSLGACKRDSRDRGQTEGVSAQKRWNEQFLACAVESANVRLHPHAGYG